jgi:hypothetical protein
VGQRGAVTATHYDSAPTEVKATLTVVMGAVGGDFLQPKYCYKFYGVLEICVHSEAAVRGKAVKNSLCRTKSEADIWLSAKNRHICSENFNITWKH